MRIRFGRNITMAVLTCAVLLASALLLLADDPPQFSPWSEAVLVGIVPSPLDGGPNTTCIAKNNLDLYFRSTRPVGYGLGDIYVSHRDTVDDPWETPINLGPEINTASEDTDPFVTIDGHWLYFVSNRPGGCGRRDLWVSHRKDKRDDDSWETPKNLGCIVNSTGGSETHPSVFEDEATGQTFLYFGSDRPGGKGLNDIYVSTMVGEDHEIFGAPINVSELNTEYGETAPFVRRRDGLEVIFQSVRPGGVSADPYTDLWVSTRPDTLSPWSTPVNLGAPVNTFGNEGWPSLSWDGTTLYLASNRPPGPGVHMATRTKLKDPD